MKKIFILILFIYSIVMTIFAIPTIKVAIEEVEPQVSLDAGASDDQWKFLQDLSKLVDYADSLGYKLTGGELWRTMYQQRYNVAHGLSWTYNSKHLKRRAIDLNLFIDDRYQQTCEAYEILGQYWESLDPKNRWGGSWKHTKDCPHFERR